MIKDLQIVVCQVAPVLGKPRKNAEIIADISQKTNADLLLFPELFLTGYHPRDLLTQRSFLNELDQTLSRLEFQIKTPVLFGSPILEENKLYNSAVFLGEGKKKIFKKLKLPFYNVFNENRYFTVPKDVSLESLLLEIKGFRLIVSICEDLWPNKGVFPSHYEHDPLSLWKRIKKTHALVNLSASPYAKGYFKERENLLLKISEDLSCPVVYVNELGLNEEILFDGASMLVSDLSIQRVGQSFKEDFISFSIKEDKKLDVPKKKNIETEEERLLSALIFAIKEFFAQSGFKKAVLGLSGGMDSSLVCVLTTLALGKENVFPLMLPSPYSSSGSVDHSLVLVKNLGLKIKEFSISKHFELFTESLKKNLARPHLKPLTKENAQARIRALVLMAFSSEEDALVVNCSNKSEIAVGYSTLYGDTVGACSPLGDLYKSDVYALAKFINREKEIIPKIILEKEPSAELSPNQKDSDSLPPYSVLDAVLYQAFEEAKSKEEIIKTLNLDPSLVEDVFKRIKRSEFKRFQAAPIFRVSRLAFGSGRRVSLSSKYEGLSF